MVAEVELVGCWDEWIQEDDRVNKSLDAWSLVSWLENSTKPRTKISEEAADSQGRSWVWF